MKQIISILYLLWRLFVWPIWLYYFKNQCKGIVSVGAVGAFAPTVFEDYCIYPYKVLEFALTYRSKGEQNMDKEVKIAPSLKILKV